MEKVATIVAHPTFSGQPPYDEDHVGERHP